MQPVSPELADHQLAIPAQGGQTPSQAIVPSLLRFPDAAAEEQFRCYVQEEFERYRELLGCDVGSYGYREGTLLDKWQRYQEMWEQDFSRRQKDEHSIFAQSNLTLNLPMTQVSQHGDRMTNDLISSPAFFGPRTEGLEDQHPGIDVLKQRLHFKAKEIGLHEHGKRGMQGALIRGQEILRASYSEHASLRPVKLSQTLVNGQPVKDSKGVPVLSSDEWDAHPDTELMAGAKVLRRDPAIIAPAGAVFSNTPPQVMMKRFTKDPGCDLKAIHFGDFVCLPTAESIEQSPLKGHAFRMNPGDMFVNMGEGNLLPGAAEYLEKHKQEQLTDSLETDYLVRAVITNQKKGEDDENVETQKGDAKGRHRKRTYYEIWVRYDADGDGYDEDIYCLIDATEKRVIHYEYAHFILEWQDADRPHPYILFRIWPQMHRWTGTGYYELLETWSMVVDKMLNRIEIDAATSGNVIFENPMATVEGSIEGQGIQFRNNMSYELTPGFTAKEALEAVRVEPANLEIFNNIMERFIGRVEVQGALVSPQEASVSDVPGSDTLGVAKILENTASQSLRARENEILVGLTALLHAFADIEVYAILRDQTHLVEQVGEEKAAALMEWLNLKPGNWRQVFEVSLTKAHSTQMLQNANAILATLERWMQTPPEYKVLHQPTYRRILAGLDDPTPDLTLNVNTSIAADQAGMMREAMAGAIGGDGSAPPPAK